MITQNTYRILPLQILIGITGLLLTYKMFEVQVLDNTYQTRASAMLFEEETVYPSRGIIYDRDKNVLVTNNPNYDIHVTFNQVSANMDTAKFCTLLELTTKEFREQLSKSWSSGKYSKNVPFAFMSNLSSTQVAAFQEHLHEFPGFSLQLRNYREYPVNTSPHVIGYISEINRKELSKEPDMYNQGDYIGTSGLERSYESFLRGKKGKKFVVKDNLGRVVSALEKGDLDMTALSGSDLFTSLDVELQQYAEKLLDGKIGSVVALDPNTGDVLLIASSPGYDPNILSIKEKRGEAYKLLSSNDTRPLFHRAISAKYPPGSIFKCVLSLIALQDGIITPQKKVYCGGGHWYNEEFRKCHEHSSPVNMKSALQHSCNTYFFDLFMAVVDQYGFNNPRRGLDSLLVKLNNFGLGTTINIDLPNESAGNLPTSNYYDRIYPKWKGGWKSPTIMSLGIGQGEMELSTLQIANLAAIIANQGFYYPPHLVQSISGSDSLDLKYSEKIGVDINQDHFDPVIQGMYQVVEWGTGFNAKVWGVEVCGKTGTSQNPHGADHSVFFAFAPREKPKIAIATLIENGGDGNVIAAPITGLLIEKFLNDTVSVHRAGLEKYVINKKLIKKP